MTLSKEEKSKAVLDALALFPTRGVTDADLTEQGDAFQWCLDLFNSLQKTKRINWNFSSYGLKHLVENPTGRYGVCPTIDSAYRGYVFEGTLVLAAKATGFDVSGPGLNVAFNFSKASLMSYLTDVASTLRDPVLRAKTRGVRRYEVLSCSMRPDLIARLRETAHEKGTSVSLELRAAVEAHLSNLVPALRFFFDGDLYYAEGADGKFTTLSRSAVLTRLVQAGYAHPSRDGFASPAERELNRIQRENYVDGIPGGAV